MESLTRNSKGTYEEILNLEKKKESYKRELLEERVLTVAGKRRNFFKSLWFGKRKYNS